MNDNWDKYQSLVLDKLDGLEKGITELKVDYRTISNRVSNIEKVQVENTSDVRYHIRRTDLAEQRVEKVERRLETEIKELRNSVVDMNSEMKKEIQETREAVQGWKANLSLLGWLFSAVTVLAAILLRFYNF